MTRRVAAGLLALGLLAVLCVQAGGKDVPWVVFTPGITVDVLGQSDGKPIVQVTGHKTYPDDGQLRMLTVFVTPPKGKVGLLESIFDWRDPDVTVLPRSVVYAPQETNESNQKESAVQMATSQDLATAAALDELGIKYRDDVLIAAVAADGASQGILKTGDVVRSVNGTATGSASKLVAAVSAVKPGSKVRLAIRRGSTDKTVVVTTRADPGAPKKSRINVSIGEKPVFPFKVTINLGENIGGPSAGMMFALSIYDVLTPGSLTGGKVIAGTGTIDSDGVVGPIGGIGQKMVAAQRDGAKLFLLSDENCAEAAAAHYDKNKMVLVKVHTVSNAIKEINAWRQNPNGELSRCTK